MRNILILIGIVGSIGLGIFGGSRVNGAVTNILTPSPKVTQEVTAIPTAVPTPTPTTPRLLQIPRLGVHASIQPVGMDAQGRMDVPTTWTEVGWYDLGFKPGEKGSAVMDGHLDDTSGAPAVFWYIKDLQPGDQIIVTDNNNQTYTFVVTKTTSYPFNEAPMQEIFDTTDQSRLNLITCDGSWDRSTHNYSNRIVVYSELQK
jgi:hypothetical protein